MIATIALAACIAMVPLPPKRGDGGKVQYIELKLKPGAKLPPGAICKEKIRGPSGS